MYSALLTLGSDARLSAKDCAYISGHKHLSSFEVYVKTSKDEAAERMAANAFFR